MVYLVRYACHVGAQASEGVDLLDHEPLIVGQLQSACASTAHGLVDHSLYIRAAVLGVARLASLLVVGCVAGISLSTAVHARLNATSTKACIATVLARVSDALLLAHPSQVSTEARERLVDTASVAYLSGHVITLETYVLLT